MDAFDCSRKNAENFSPQGFAAVPPEELSPKFQMQNAKADELVGRKIEMERECPPAAPGKRRAEWLMLSKREEGQTWSPRSPRKHVCNGKRASWGISLLIPSEAPPAEVRRDLFYLRLLCQNSAREPCEGNNSVDGYHGSLCRQPRAGSELDFVADPWHNPRCNASRDIKEPFEGMLQYLSAALSLLAHLRLQRRTCVWSRG